MKLALVLSCFLWLVIGVNAVPARFGLGRKPAPVMDRTLIDSNAIDSNAKRFAAGLPPLPARRLWSKTSSAKRGGTSPMISKYTGKLGVTSKNGTSLGFISKVLNVDGGYTLSSDDSHAAVVSFTASNSGSSSRLSIDDQTSSSPNATFFGAVIPHGDTLAVSKSTIDASGLGTQRRDTQGTITDHVTIAGVAQTPPGSTPQGGPNTVQQGSGNGGGSTSGSGMDGESAIWTFDPTSGKWQLTWINYDGSAVPTEPFFNPGSGADSSSIQMVSDTTSYMAANPSAVAIILNLAK